MKPAAVGDVLILIYSNNLENILSNVMFDMRLEATPISLRLRLGLGLGLGMVTPLSTYLHAKLTV